MVAKPLVHQFVSYSAYICHTYGGHGLVLHTSAQCGKTHAVFLLPKGVSAKQRREVVYHVVYTVKFDFVRRIEGSCIHKEIMNQHRVGAAGEVHIGFVIGISGYGNRYQVIVYRVAGAPVVSPIASSSGGIGVQ